MKRRKTHNTSTNSWKMYLTGALAGAIITGLASSYFSKDANKEYDLNTSQDEIGLVDTTSQENISNQVVLPQKIADLEKIVDETPISLEKDTASIVDTLSNEVQSKSYDVEKIAETHMHYNFTTQGLEEAQKRAQKLLNYGKVTQEKKLVLEKSLVLADSLKNVIANDPFHPENILDTYKKIDSVRFRGFYEQ